MADVSFQQEILGEYFRQDLDPFSTVQDDAQIWRTQLAKVREEITEQLEMYNRNIVALQNQALSTEAKSNELLVKELQKQEVLAETFSTLQEHIQDFGKRVQEFQLTGPFETKLYLPRNFLNFLRELKEIADQTGERLTGVPSFRISTDLEPIITKFLDMEEQGLLNRGTFDPHQYNVLTNTILTRLKTEVSRLLNLMGSLKAQKEFRGHKREDTYRVAREINRLENLVKDVWAKFSELEQSIQNQVTTAQTSLNRNLAELKLALKRVPQRPDNPCNKNKNQSAVVSTQTVQGPLPALNNPNFGLELRDKIVQTHPELQLDRKINVTQSGCANTSQGFVPTAHQVFADILAHPRFVKIRGLLYNAGVGSGKTAIGLENVRSWEEHASDDYHVSRDALVLMPNEQNIIDWEKEAKEKMGFRLRNALYGAPGSRTRYYILGEGAREFHIVLQLFTQQMDPAVIKQLLANNREWATFPFADMKNDYEDFPEIYGTVPSSQLPTPFRYPKQKFVENFYLPVRGLIIGDEFHLAVNPQDIRGNVINMAYAMTWALSVKKNQQAKIILMTATVTANTDRTLDAFKLLNVLKRNNEPQVAEGVWKAPIGASEFAKNKVVIKKKLKDVFELENRYVRSLLADQPRLLTLYSGMVSYMTLDQDASVYPQVTTRCGDQVEGCIVKYTTTGVATNGFAKTEVVGHNPELKEKLRAIPVYISTKKKKGKSKKEKTVYTASELIRAKLPVILDILKQSPQEKRFIFTGSKRYQDFFQYARAVIVSAQIPYYDIIQLKEDLEKLPSLPPTIAEVADALDAQKENLQLHLATMKQALLIFAPTASLQEMQKILSGSLLFDKISAVESTDKKKSTESDRVRTNRGYVQRVMMELFNRKPNVTGSMFQAFVSDLGGREGLSLFSTANVDILQVPKSITTLVQAAGRVTRYCSFRDSAQKQPPWLVRVYIYILTQDVCDLSKIDSEGESECAVLSRLLFADTRSLADEVQRFLRSVAIDCILFSLYITPPGMPISCGLLQNMSEEDFRNRFMSGTRPPTEESFSSSSSFGKVCVFPNSYRFEAESEEGDFFCSAEKGGEVQELPPYNEIDAWILRVLVETHRIRVEQEEIAQNALRVGTAAVENTTVQSTETKETKDQKQVPSWKPAPPLAVTATKASWLAWLQRLKSKVGSYFTRSEAENEGERDSAQDDRVSFQIMYPYLTCQSFTPGKVSYHKIYQDIGMVSETYQNQWMQMLQRKRQRTEEHLGLDYVKGLDALSEAYWSILKYQLQSHFDLLQVKAGLRTVPASNVSELQDKKVQQVPLEPAPFPEWIESDEKGEPLPLSPSPEIRYVLAEYDIDRADATQQHTHSKNLDIDE